jgi:mannose-6-phosphate isomerase
MSAATRKRLAYLQCAVQHYDWGERGSASTVARLQAAASDPPLAIDEKKPYAELWMGTHKGAPSQVVLPDGKATEPLSAWAGGELPYLFKVLSVRTALSIQAHPTKEHGARLHASAPKLYPDPNHKPEMAVAVTYFEALCGFRPIRQIAGFLKSVPELRAIIGNDLATEFEAMAAAASEGGDGDDSKSSARNPLLQKVFTALMQCPSATLQPQLSALIARLSKEPAPSSSSGTINGGTDVELTGLVQRLNSQYPNDVGVFCPYLLNAIVMQPGDAIFLPANEPHAYLKGDCVGNGNTRTAARAPHNTGLIA